MATDDIKIKLSPYLGCSKKLIEFFAIIGYQEEAIKRNIQNISEIHNKLDLTFLSIVISDISFEFVDSVLIKQIYPTKPAIITSEENAKLDNIIFFQCTDAQSADKKFFYSCYALRFYEKIRTRNNEVYFVPKAFLIYSQYPYFSTFSRICEKVLYSTDERYADKEFPIEIFLHCLVNYFPSPINNNLVLKDFCPHIVIPKLTGYPYADFNLGKILSLMNINEFIKIYILIFLELDLLFFSPNLEKLNIFMFALYILNYPLTDSIYFWYIKTISLEDINNEMGDEQASTTFRGANIAFYPALDLSNFKALNFVIDLENKKQPIITITDNNEAREINLLLKYLHNILNGSIFSKKTLFLGEYILKLQKNLKNILKDYNTLAMNDSNVANSFFYMNKSIMNINRQIQEIFYDFILNILVELNKDRISNSKINPQPNAPGDLKEEKKFDSRLTEEEIIFLKYLKASIKYGLYFNNFIDNFNAFDEIKVSLLFSDEYVNLKKQDIDQSIEGKIKYFEIMDKLYILKQKDLIYDLKAFDTEYTRINCIPSSIKANKKNPNLFTLNKEIIKKFIYEKRNHNLYEILKEPDEIKIDTENKNSLIFSIQYFLTTNGILKNLYFLRGSTSYIISICFAFFPKEKLTLVIDEYLENSIKMKYFQRYYIFIILKAINKYYKLNKEKGTFPEMTFNNVRQYYKIINNHLEKHLIYKEEELSLFFKNHLTETEENLNENNLENEFSFNSKDLKFELDILEINKNLKITENEIYIKVDNDVIKFNRIKNEDIPLFFQEIYSYYDFFLSKDFDIKNIEVNKLLEKAANLIKFFGLFKDEQKFIKIFYHLIKALNAFRNQLKNYNEKNE